MTQTIDTTRRPEAERRELREWYRASLQPKLAKAARDEVVEPAAVAALDALLHAFLAPADPEPRS